MDNYSYIANAHGEYIDQMYADYKKDPASVDVTWQRFFEGFEFSQIHAEGGSGSIGGVDEKEAQVHYLIHAYRSRAHLKAATNPVRERTDRMPRLDLEDYDLTEKDLDVVFQAGKEIGIGAATLRDIIAALKKIYEGTIGFEYMYIRHRDRLDWFKQKFEKESLGYKPDPENIRRILSKLNEAVVFENFLHTKYVGQKRFSLEGGETTIAALDALINTGADLGSKEFVIGMAHRGRLNVLCNIMGKTYEQIFNEFEGASLDMSLGDGDVKYHMGFSSEVTTLGGKEVRLRLMPNPSHLEAVNPVVLGYTRAKADRLYNGDENKIVPILIHGDAAIAGQGIMYEIVQMHKLRGYKTGGTIHFVINNQVGFTTDYVDARSSIYCTDIAKTIDAPVLHVNGDDPEAVVFCMKMAMEYRNKFNRDIFIDMVCYRRHGHNESDEPKFTQPKMYSIISKHPNPREIYNKKLIERGDISADVAKQMDKQFRELLQDRLNMVKQKPLPYKLQETEEEWQVLRKSTSEDFEKSPNTGIKADVIKKVGEALIKTPQGFKPLKQIERLLKTRKEMFAGKQPLDWAAAELLAYGSLLSEGVDVRLSGQDVQRGTFSHRHAILTDASTNEPYNSLSHIEGSDKKFEVYNSLLSEYGVLGFEFGYGWAHPNTLPIWEAQFGDFANGAQVMIDQFITTTETKWAMQNGLVMLLPHGQEGQGPEHSSARLERFLTSCARYNITVANLTTPANFFHVMRRQIVRPFRKPLVVMSPKSLLRNPAVVSEMSEFTKGGFKEVIGDDYVDAKKVSRVLICSGKVYFDLLEEQQKSKRKDIAIIRLEQVYPIAYGQLDKELAKYKKDVEIKWVQEEPGNSGAWGYILRSFHDRYPVQGIAKSDSPSPAVGYSNVHKKLQAEIVKKSFS